MAARINNFPKYVIYDRSIEASISGTSKSQGNGGVTETNTAAETRDYDFDTYYQVKAVSTGGTTGNAAIFFDYGKVLTNVVIAIKYYYKNDSLGNATFHIERSLDDSSYTDLTSDVTVVAGASDTVEEILTGTRLRYIKVYMDRAATSDLTVRVYELRIMGAAL